jgi:hypothetical protein
MDGILVHLEGFYSLLMDWARVSDVPNPERYYIDPQSESSLKAQENQRAQQKVQRDQQAQMVKQAVELEKLGRALEKYKADLDGAIEVWAKKVDARIEYAKLGQEAEVEEARIVGAAATDILRGKRESEARREESESEPAARADAA